jgi:hypothetical protein
MPIDHKHSWILLVNRKVWVYCNCGKKFVLPENATGTRYNGPIPQDMLG